MQNSYGCRIVGVLASISAIIMVLVAATGCARADGERFQPSTDAISAADLANGFADYGGLAAGKITRAAALGTQAWRDGVEAREPFELGPEAPCASPAGKRRGFLLVHGFTDSPYSLRDVGDTLHRRDGCAVIRAIVLPGHATVPGDLLTISHEDWIAAVASAVNQMSGEVGRLWLVGFSTGAFLALNDVATHGPRNIAGLVLLSPLVRVNPPDLGPLVRPISWIKTWDSGAGLSTFFDNGFYPDENPVKYESTPWHAEAEVVALTERLDPVLQPPLGVPMLMAISADDATVDAPSALRLLCNAAPADKRKMLWYALRQPAGAAETALTAFGFPADCLRDVEIRDRAAVGAPDTIRAMAHTAIPGSPDNPIYGANGSYRSCLPYFFADPARYQLCKTRPSADVILGENGDPDASLTIQRLTFNPDFTAMMERIAAFVAANP